MSTMIVKIPKNEVMELKEMIEEGLHTFGRAMSLAERMCEDGEMGERGYNYGTRMGMRDDYEPMDDDMMMTRGGYSRYGGMGMRRGRDSMGRYTRM